MLCNLTVLASVKGLYSSRPPGGTDWVTWVTEGSYWTERIGSFLRGGGHYALCKGCTFLSSEESTGSWLCALWLACTVERTREAPFNVLIMWLKPSRAAASSLSHRPTPPFTIMAPSTPPFDNSFDLLRCQMVPKLAVRQPALNAW